MLKSCPSPLVWTPKQIQLSSMLGPNHRRVAGKPKRQQEELLRVWLLQIPAGRYSGGRESVFCKGPASPSSKLSRKTPQGQQFCPASREPMQTPGASGLADTPLPYLPGIVPSSSRGSQGVRRLRPETPAMCTTVFFAWFGDKNNCCFLLSHTFHWGHLGQDWVKASRRSGNNVEANSGDVSIGHTLPSPLQSRGIRAASHSLQNWPWVAFLPLFSLPGVFIQPHL